LVLVVQMQMAVILLVVLVKAVPYLEVRPHTLVVAVAEMVTEQITLVALAVAGAVARHSMALL